MVAAEVHAADQGDTATLPGTLAAAAKQLAAVEVPPTPENPSETPRDLRDRASLSVSAASARLRASMFSTTEMNRSGRPAPSRISATVRLAQTTFPCLQRCRFSIFQVQIVRMGDVPEAKGAQLGLGMAENRAQPSIDPQSGAVQSDMRHALFERGAEALLALEQGAFTRLVSLRQLIQRPCQRVSSRRSGFPDPNDNNHAALRVPGAVVMSSVWEWQWMPPWLRQQGGRRGAVRTRENSSDLQSLAHLPALTGHCLSRHAGTAASTKSWLSRRGHYFHPNN
nr:hypothetical protein [Rhodovastum atsumiense]